MKASSRLLCLQPVITKTEPQHVYNFGFL